MLCLTTVVYQIWAIVYKPDTPPAILLSVAQSKFDVRTNTLHVHQHTSTDTSIFVRSCICRSAVIPYILTGANESRDVTVANTSADRLYFQRTAINVRHILTHSTIMYPIVPLQTRLTSIWFILGRYCLFCYHSHWPDISGSPTH